jgi:hypothetical protein
MSWGCRASLALGCAPAAGGATSSSDPPLLPWRALQYALTGESGDTRQRAMPMQAGSAWQFRRRPEPLANKRSGAGVLERVCFSLLVNRKAR